MKAFKFLAAKCPLYSTKEPIPFSLYEKTKILGALCGYMPSSLQNETSLSQLMLPACHTKERDKPC